MTGQEAVELIHQEAWTGRTPGLSRTTELLRRVGDPHKKLRFVHITGTNGKGSTAAMVASVLIQSGRKTGLYKTLGRLHILRSARHRFLHDEYANYSCIRVQMSR